MMVGGTPRGFRRGDIVIDPVDGVYRVLGQVRAFGPARPARLRLQLWMGNGFDPKVYELPADTVRPASEESLVVQAIRKHEAVVQKIVQRLCWDAIHRTEGAR